MNFFQVSVAEEILNNTVPVAPPVVPVDPNANLDGSMLIDSLRHIFQDFNAAWFLGLATICYLLIQILRGKMGFQIPYVTPWVEKLSKEAKTYIILLLFAGAGVFTSFGNTPITIWTLLDGFFAGLSAGVATIGTRSAFKQGMEGVVNLKQKMDESKKLSNK